MAEKPNGLNILFEKYKEIIMYCIFGVVTTLVSWVIYSLCMAVLPLALDPKMYISGIVSWIIAVAVAFVTNKLWVFDSKSWEAKLVIKEAISFVGGRAFTGILEVIAVPALVKLGLDMVLFGTEGLPAKIIVSVVIVILNYILSKYLAFDAAKKEK